MQTAAYPMNRQASTTSRTFATAVDVESVGNSLITSCCPSLLLMDSQPSASGRLLGALQNRLGCLSVPPNLAGIVPRINAARV